MTEPDRQDRAAASHWTIEVAMALILLAFGALVMADSVRIGARWAEDGPEAGYFPFYVGLILCVVSAMTLATSLRRSIARTHAFVSVSQLRLILRLLVPFAVFIVAIRPLGLYLASALFIAYFMLRVGEFPRWLSALVPIATVTALFLMFERWFAVPLPKGPLETLLGLN